MNTWQMLFIGLILIGLCSADGFAFRCGNDLVTTGDTKTQVRIACGKPTSAEKICEEGQSATSVNRKGKTVKKCGAKVDVWYYNCGDNDYIYALTFENGKLKKEDPVGRGKGKSDCLGN